MLPGKYCAAAVKILDYMYGKLSDYKHIEGTILLRDQESIL